MLKFCMFGEHLRNMRAYTVGRRIIIAYAFKQRYAWEVLEEVLCLSLVTVAMEKGRHFADQQT